MGLDLGPVLVLRLCRWSLRTALPCWLGPGCAAAAGPPLSGTSCAERGGRGKRGGLRVSPAAGPLARVSFGDGERCN